MRLAILILGLATPAFCQTLDDRHLPATGRTAEDIALATVLRGLATGATGLDPSLAPPGGQSIVPFTGQDDAFSQPLPGLDEDGLRAFDLGNALFRKLWVAAPVAMTASDGLGPLWNARSCQACHLRDGRGHPPKGPEDDRTSMVLRLSIPGGTAPDGIAEWITTSSDPSYGSQLQDFAAPGQVPEGRLEVSYVETEVSLADGSKVSLRTPSYSLGDPGYGAASEGLLLSPRIAPQMIGLGLLEAVPAADILALTDPDDANGDGISGRAQIVPSPEFGVPMLGRFGLKAGAATIREQVASALALDMGLSNPLFPDAWGDCTATQTACRDAPHGQEPDIRDGLEVEGQALDLLTLYSRNLAVPDRRNPDDPLVLQGEALFQATGCALCHQPAFLTHRLEGQPWPRAQVIWPYTDLLLHDMGPGLADQRPEGRASGSEWRTPPLWGIGLTETVSGHTQFLHDGRARSLLEAILWHGGEAQGQRDAVVAMTATERTALLAFLESL